MSYTLTQSNGIRLELENGSMMFLPPENNGTPEWRQYQEWLDAGNTPNPYVPLGYETLDSAKTTRTSEIKQEAYQLLSTSDWMVVRAAEGGSAVPSEWSTYRADVRTESDRVVSEINSCSSVDDVIAVTPSWPTKP